MSQRFGIVPLMPAGGVNDSAGPQMIPDEQVAAVRNFRFGDGDWTMRGGTTKYISSTVAAAAVTGLKRVTFQDASVRLVAAAGTALVRDNSGSWTSIKGALTFTAGQNNLFTMAVLNDHIIGTNGVDQLWKYNPATDPAVVLSGTPPSKARTLMAFRNRIVCGNIVDGTYTGDTGKGVVKWCALNNPDDWTTSSAGDAQPRLKGGQEIRALATVGTSAFVFYDQSIYQMEATGDDAAPFVFSEHADQMGALGQQGVVVVSGDQELLFFVHTSGVYVMAPPSYVPQRISVDIDGTWATVNKGRLQYASAGWFPKFNEVWFSVSTNASTTNNLVLVFDYSRKVWSFFDATPANAFTNYTDGDGASQLLYGDYSGYVHYNENGTSDNGTAIDAYVTTKAYPLVDGRRRGMGREVFLHLQSQGSGSQVEFNYGYDLGALGRQKTVDQSGGGDTYDITGVWDTSVWGSEGQVNRLINLKGEGHHLQMQLRQRRLNDSCHLYRMELGIKRQGRRQEAA